MNKDIGPYNISEKGDVSKERVLGSGVGGVITLDQTEINGISTPVAIKRPNPHNFNLTKLQENFEWYLSWRNQSSNSIIEELKCREIPNLGGSEIGKIIRDGYSDPKHMLPTTVGDPNFLQFTSEADTLAMLAKNPKTAKFIPQIYEATIDLTNFNQSKIVMEYIPGDLYQASQSLMPTERISLATDMIEAVRAFHEAGVSLTDFGPDKFDRFRLRTTIDENGNPRRELVVIDFSASGDSAYQTAIDDDINNLKLHLFHHLTNHVYTRSTWVELKRRMEKDEGQEYITLSEFIEKTPINTLQDLLTEIKPTVGDDTTLPELVQALQTKKEEMILQDREIRKREKESFPFLPITKQLGATDVPQETLMRVFPRYNLDFMEFIPYQNQLAQFRSNLITELLEFNDDIFPEIKDDLEKGGYDFNAQLLDMNLSTLQDVKNVLHNMEVIEDFLGRNPIASVNLDFIPKLKELASLIGSLHEARGFVYEGKPTETPVSQVLDNLGKIQVQFPGCIFFTDLGKLIATLDQQSEV